MAKLTCEICGVDIQKRYAFRYPNTQNKDTTKYICKDCHQALRVIINQSIDATTSYTAKIDGFYPVVYPNAMNDETTRYISLEDYRALENKINAFIENGGL